MSEQKSILVDVTSVEGIIVSSSENHVTLNGKIFQIFIRDDKEEAVVGFRILPDGSLDITSYKTVYTQDVPRKFRLNNERPW